MDASLSITETYQAICVMLLLVAIWFRCVKRAFLLALTGLGYFSTDAQFQILIWNKLHTLQNISRPFLLTYAGLFIIVFINLIELIIMR
jgi:hypothetical protein